MGVLQTWNLLPLTGITVSSGAKTGMMEMHLDAVAQGLMIPVNKIVELLSWDANFPLSVWDRAI
jgi:hypothetical protein